MVQGLDGFQKPLRPCALDESSLSIGSVKILLDVLSKWKNRKVQLLYHVFIPLLPPSL